MNPYSSCAGTNYNKMKNSLLYKLQLADSLHRWISNMKDIFKVYSDVMMLTLAVLFVEIKPWQWILSLVQQLKLYNKTRQLACLLTNIDSNHWPAPVQTRQPQISRMLIIIMVFTNTECVPLIPANRAYVCTWRVHWGSKATRWGLPCPAWTLLRTYSGRQHGLTPCQAATQAG